VSDGESSVSRYSRHLAREPDGWPQNLIFLYGAGLLYLVSVYGWTRGTILLAQPLFGTTLALSGVAESLPTARQQTAFRLRLLGVLLAGAVTVVGVVGLVGGPQLLVS
jgi:hypothetical protein